MKLFNEVYVQLAAVDAAQKSKSAPPPAGGGERVKAAAGQQPEPARSVLEKVAGAAAASGRVAEREGLTGELKPISRVLHPGDHRALSVRLQLEGRRAARRLRPAVRRRRHVRRLLPAPSWPRWSTPAPTPGASSRLADGTKPVNAAALADFQRAARIKEVFFRGGGKTPAFKVDMRAVEMDDGLKEMNLDDRRHGLQVPRRQHHAGDA